MLCVKNRSPDFLQVVTRLLRANFSPQKEKKKQPFFVLKRTQRVYLPRLTSVHC